MTIIILAFKSGLTLTFPSSFSFRIFYSLANKHLSSKNFFFSHAKQHHVWVYASNTIGGFCKKNGKERKCSMFKRINVTLSVSVLRSCTQNFFFSHLVRGISGHGAIKEKRTAHGVQHISKKKTYESWLQFSQS